MAQSHWQPQQEQLRQLAGFLVESLNSKDVNSQKKAEIVSPFAPILARTTY